MNLERRIAAAQGKEPADWILRGVSYLDVFSCEWREGDVAVADGVVVGLDPGLKSKQEIQAKGKWLVPGLIDAHVHVESSMMVPPHFDAAVLARGTTAAVCDPHELANVQGLSGLSYFLDAAENTAIDLWVMLSSCVPATHLETNGGGTIGAEQLLSVAGHPRALGLAEMMNMPGVLNADPEVIKKLRAFRDSRIDGHCPLLRGPALSAYAAAGISSCHESSELEEAREKLSKGISVWIREGSVAKDLDALAPLINLGTSTSLGFCTDDRNPLDIAEEGHVDHLVRGAIRRGVAPEVAFRAASWSVARHYGLDRGASPLHGRVGAVAPGYQADLLLLEDLKSVAVSRVWKGGKPAAEALAARSHAGRAVNGPGVSLFPNTIQAVIPEERDLAGPSGSVRVIGIQPGKIITDHLVLPHDARGVARLSVLERYGRSGKPANGYVRGFGASFSGAIASSVGHDSHNLIAVGCGPEALKDMRAALASLIESGGGFSVVQNGKVLSRLALPLGGLMSAMDAGALKAALVELKSASRSIGCELTEPFLQLAFLSLPVIPKLKLTDRGLVDVERFEIVGVRAS